MAQTARNIGVEVNPPSRHCTDPNCPFHGTLSVRGQIIDGQVVSAKMEHSAVVRREYLRYMPKYERYEKRTSRYTVHHPHCIDLKAGDLVKIMECRPLSKTKHFVIIEAKAGELRITGEDYTEERRIAAEAKAAKDAAAAAAAESATTKKPKKVS